MSAVGLSRARRCSTFAASFSCARVDFGGEELFEGRDLLAEAGDFGAQAGIVVGDRNLTTRLIAPRCCASSMANVFIASQGRRV